MHVFRDPRGFIFSRYHIHKSEDIVGQLHIRSQEYCAQSAEDLKYIRRLLLQDERLVRQAYHTVRYEDLALDIQNQMDLLYRFLRVPPDDALLRLVNRVYSASRPSANKSHKRERVRLFGTYRNDPSYTATAWTSTIPFTLVKSMQNNCKEFMSMAGYVPVLNEDQLRSRSSPIMYKVFPFFQIKQNMEMA